MGDYWDDDRCEGGSPFEMLFLAGVAAVTLLTLDAFDHYDRSLVHQWLEKAAVSLNIADYETRIKVDYDLRPKWVAPLFVSDAEKMQAEIAFLRADEERASNFCYTWDFHKKWPQLVGVNPVPLSCVCERKTDGHDYDISCTGSGNGREVDASGLTSTSRYLFDSWRSGRKNVSFTLKIGSNDVYSSPRK